MPQEISDYLSHDHDRLDQFLQQSLAANGTINMESYHQFRQGLLRHIGIEEKMKESAEVRSLPNNPDPKILEATRRALERAGYDPGLLP